MAKFVIVQGTCIMDTESPKITVTPTTVTLSIGHNIYPNYLLYLIHVSSRMQDLLLQTLQVNTNNPGTFVIRYDASDDASGNRPDPVLITIIVEAAGTPDTTPPTICSIPPKYHIRNR